MSLKPDLNLILFIAVLVVVSIAIAHVLKPITNYFENYLFERQTAKRVKKLRAENNNAPVRVRQTDITSQMSREDRALYKRAELLFDEGQVLASANIFEQIKFQRKAIDILEEAGLIDEACNVLVRIKAVGRAGVLYERHNMLDKAAQCFSEANQDESAGNVYIKMAVGNFRYYMSASDAFAKAEKWHKMLKAAAAVLATQKVVESAIAHGEAEFLVDYLSHSFLANSVLPKLTLDQLTKMFTGLPLTPRLILTAAHWARHHSLPHLDQLLLNYVHTNVELCAFFWSCLDSSTQARLADMVEQPDLLCSQARVVHQAHLQNKKAHAS